jgi:hypothetical protein
MRKKPGTQYHHMGVDSLKAAELTEDDLERARKYLKEHKAEDVMEALAL